MAASDGQPFPVKNKAFCVVFPILDADGDLVSGATGLDSEISKDLGNFTDCSSEATEIGVSSGMYYLNLSATEMNADIVSVIVKTSSSGAKTTPMVFYPVDIKELAAVPGFSDGATGLEELLSYLLALSRNKMTQTSTVTTLKKDDGSTTLATATVSDDGTTFTRNEWS